MNSLLCVDLQTEYTRYIPFWSEKEIELYAKKFDNIYCIYDISESNKDKIKPIFNFQFQSERDCYKTYDTFMYEILLEDQFAVYDEKNRFISDKENFLQQIKDLTSFYVMNGRNGMRYVSLKVPTFHKFVEISSDIASFVNKLPESITLIGGAVHECLDDVFYTLKFFGKKPIINYEYTF